MKRWDRKSVEPWWLGSVLCPSTLSSRSSSKAHLRRTVRSPRMTHPREEELHGAGSRANKHFTICGVYWSTPLTYIWTRRLPMQTRTSRLCFIVPVKRSVNDPPGLMCPCRVTHVMTVPLKHTTVKPPWSAWIFSHFVYWKKEKRQVCHRCRYRHGDRVKSQTGWYYTVLECMLITLCSNF